MKSCAFLLVFILVILTSSAAAQVDKSDFFPTQVGNYWEYEYYDSQANERRWLKITATSDTLMPDNSYYVHFREQTIDDSGKLLLTEDYYYRKDSNGIYTSLDCSKVEGYKLFDLTPGLKDKTIWETCGRSFLGISLWRGVLIHYDEQYSPLQDYGEEARLFVDVAVDTTNDNVLWGPSDGSEISVLVKGLGMVYRSCTSCYAPFILRGAIINGKQIGTITSAENRKNMIPTSLKIQNYPNPFNPTTTINYSIPKASFVELKVFDMLGREVRTLVNKVHNSGEYKIRFDGAEIPSGMYIYQLRAGEHTAIRKMILLK